MNSPINDRLSRFALRAALLALCLLACSCRVTEPPPRARDGAATPASSRESVVEFVILQMADVYEISPVGGGESGGLARVAHIRQQLIAENPNTFTVIAGDFFSPSALGTAKVDGERLAGRQMVATLNALGTDIATFGNHEFDVNEKQFRRLLDESRFRWVSSNVREADGRPYAHVADEIILGATHAGKTVRVGFFGVTLDSNPQDWVTYIDVLSSAQRKVAELEGRCDVIVALTHLDLADDIKLAAEVPGIDLILGGHEHENIELRRGERMTPIAKADANARAVYVHRLRYDTESRNLEIDSKLVPVGNHVPEDPATRAVVEKWTQLAYEGFRKEGFDPDATVAQVPVALDGRESSVRNRSTTLTELIADAALHEGQGSGAELAFFNGGSIRIDDVLPPGPVSEYDVIRVLPFGGKFVTIKIRGDVLAKTLDAGLDSTGKGGFLQTAKVTGGRGAWVIAGSPLDPARTYVATVSDFLVSGREQGMEFLNLGAPGVELVENHRDVRRALIEELQRRYRTN